MASRGQLTESGHGPGLVLYRAWSWPGPVPGLVLLLVDRELILVVDLVYDSSLYYGHPV